MFLSLFFCFCFFSALQGTLACHSSLAYCATSSRASASLSFVSWSPSSRIGRICMEIPGTPNNTDIWRPRGKSSMRFLRCCTCCTCCKWLILGGGFKDFIFSSLFGEMIQFDWYFSDGLKPPTSGCLVISNHFPYNDLESFNWKFQDGIPQKLGVRKSGSRTLRTIH